MTRASTPGSLSTRTDSVWRSVAGFFISMASHHHFALFGDRVLEINRGVAEQHLVMRPAGRDHREAVLRGIDHAIEDHRAIGLEHRADRIIELGGLGAADTDAMVGLGELDEVRPCLRLPIPIAPTLTQPFPLP